MTGSLRRTASQLFAGVLLLTLSTSAPALSEELRIGFLAPRTGIFTQPGSDMVNGFQMYLDEHDGKLGGAKVTFIVEDDQGKPDVDVTKAKKLILQDKVDMQVGAVLASSAYALAPVSTAEKPAAQRLSASTAIAPIPPGSAWPGRWLPRPATASDLAARVLPSRSGTPCRRRAPARKP